jgi:hypothetical protein
MADFTFTDWELRFPMEASEPLREAMICAGTCFIRVSTTSPLPATSHWETWGWTDDARTMLGYAMHVVLPNLVATWFFEQSEGDRLPSRDYLALARQHDSHVQDIPIVEDVLAVVEAISPAQEQDEILAGLARASEMWNERFARTGTWNLRFDVFANLESAGYAFWQRYFEQHPPERKGDVLTKAGWMELCRTVDDPVAHEFIVEWFSEGFF